MFQIVRSIVTVYSEEEEEEVPKPSGGVSLECIWNCVIEPNRKKKRFLDTYVLSRACFAAAHALGLNDFSGVGKESAVFSSLSWKATEPGVEDELGCVSPRLAQINPEWTLNPL